MPLPPLLLEAVESGHLRWYVPIYLIWSLILAVRVSWICVYFCQVFLQASLSFSVFPKETARCCSIILRLFFLKYEFWKLKLYTEFGFYSTILWGVDFSLSLIVYVWLWLSSQLDVGRVWKGQQFCPHGDTWHCVETFLVGTTGWEWNTGMARIEVRDAARCPTMLSDNPLPRRMTWPKMSTVLSLRDPGAVDDFISCKRYHELTPYFGSFVYPSWI